MPDAGPGGVGQAQDALGRYAQIRAEIEAQDTEDRDYWLLTVSAGEHSARATQAWAREALSTLAATGFVAVSAFQALLAAGVPLGRAAWGGATAVLPTTLRAASGFATVFWLAAAAVVLRQGGYRVQRVPERVAKPGTDERGFVKPVGTLRLGTRDRGTGRTVPDRGIRGCRAARLVMR